jgi:hypothetical protein
MCTIAWPIQARPSLELKTRPRLCPVSLSLSAASVLFLANVSSWVPTLLLTRTNTQVDVSNKGKKIMTLTFNINVVNSSYISAK